MKRILSTLLVFIFLLQGVSVLAEEKTVQYKEILTYMGIYDEAKDGIEVSRGEFVSMVLKLAGIDAKKLVSDGYPGQFVDVDESSEWYKDISIAYERGIVSGYSGEYFVPDETVSITEAVKIVLSALSFDMLAKQNGGYPNGYLAVAEEIGLLKGVSSYSVLSRDDAYKIMYNALEANLMEITVDSMGNVNYSNDNDENNILNKMDLRTEEGILTAAGYFSVYSVSSISSDDKIEINRVSYDYKNEELPYELLGKYVRAYINDEENEVVAVSEIEKNNEVTEFSFKEFIKAEKDLIKYEKNGREKNLKVSDKANVLLNGSYNNSYEYALNEKIFEYFDSVKAIDNDRDGKVDFIDVTKYEYHTVETVYPTDGIIMLGNDKGTIDTEDENNIVKLTKDEMDFTVSMLIANDTLRVKKSKLVLGYTYYDIVAARNSISGKIMGIDEDEFSTNYIINGEKYELTREYIDYLENNTTEVKAGFGETATFMLSCDGKIVFSVVASGASRYGYLMDVRKSEEAGEDEYILKIYNTEKVAKRYNASKKVTLYSEENEYYDGKKIESEALYNYLINKPYTLGLIMYELDANEEIKTLILPIDATKEEAPGKKDYPLTLDFSRTKASGWDIELYNYFGVIGQKYMLSSSTPLLLVPLKDDEKKNEENYAVKTTKNLPWDGDEMPAEGTILRMYNVSEFFLPGIMVVENDAAAKADISNFTNVAVVSGVRQGINKDDEPVNVLSYVMEGKVQESNLKSGAKIVYDDVAFEGTENMTVSDIKPGDILQINKDLNEEIDYIRVLVRRSHIGDYRTQADDGSESGFSGLTLVYGKVVNKSNTAVLVKTDSVLPMFLTTNYGTKYYTLVEEVGKKVDVSVIKLEDIRKDDEIVVRKRYNEGCEFIIYR